MHMKRYIMLAMLCLFTLVGSTAFAQRGGPDKDGRREKIEAAKVAFLTDKMALTPEQAQKFWPIYNEFEQKRRAVYMAGKMRGIDPATLSDTEAKALIDKRLTQRAKEAELEREYAAKFQKVISAKQLVQLYASEREFTKMLLKRLDDGREHEK